MLSIFKNKWAFWVLIVIISIACVYAFTLFFHTTNYYLLKTDESGYHLTGANIITNNIKIGEVGKELSKPDAKGQLFKVLLDKAIHIPSNSEVSIRKSALDSSYAIFVRFIPSPDYFTRGDTLFVFKTHKEADPVVVEPLTVSDTSVAYAEVATIVVKDTTAVIQKEVLKVNGNPEAKKDSDRKKPETGKDKVMFMVQLLASREPIDEKSKVFKGIQPIKMIKENGWYKYFTGETESFSEVSAVRSRVAESGLKDAFIVAYRGQQRISVQEARTLMK